MMLYTLLLRCIGLTAYVVSAAPLCCHGDWEVLQKSSMNGCFRRITGSFTQSTCLENGFLIGLNISGDDKPLQTSTLICVAVSCNDVTNQDGGLEKGGHNERRTRQSRTVKRSTAMSAFGNPGLPSGKRQKKQKKGKQFI